MSKKIGKDLGGVPGPRFVHRGHEVDELFVDLVAELAAFGGATVDDFALFGCLVELGCSDGGVGVEEFVEEGGVKVGVDVGFGDGGRVVCGCARGYRVPGVVVVVLLAVRGGAVCGVWCEARERVGRAAKTLSATGLSPWLIVFCLWYRARAHITAPCKIRVHISKPFLVRW